MRQAEYAGWKVAATVLIQDHPEQWVHYKAIAQKVVATELSRLGKQGGKTPEETLGKQMRAHPDLFNNNDGNYSIILEKALTDDEIREVLKAYRTLKGIENSDDRAVTESEIGQALQKDRPQIGIVSGVSLPDEEGNRDYVPHEGDWRRVVERQIRERRGQPQFRDALRERYGNRCLITGSELLAVLEAAHISPYRGVDDNHPANGLLLRSDVHTLFDLDLLGIEPEGLRVELHPEIVKEYGRFGGVTLRCAGDRRPAPEVLRLRYEQFRRRLHRPA